VTLSSLTCREQCNCSATSDYHLINVFYLVIVIKKMCLLLFCTAQQQDTFGAYDQSYTFAQPAVQPDEV